MPTSDKDRVHELAVQARKDMGRVDILVNNAGFVRHGMFWEQPVENAVKQMDVNVNALFYSIHEFLPEMLQRNSGHIVNVSSGVAITSAPGLAAYTTSKWAVWGLTDVLRLEVMAAGKKQCGNDYSARSLVAGRQAPSPQTPGRLGSATQH